MTAQVLRQAAALMRERAEVALLPENNHPWGDTSIPPTTPEQWPGEVNGALGGAMGEHCMTWTPMVALAVAALLEVIAPQFERWITETRGVASIIPEPFAGAHRIANAYLGNPGT